jgi:hypothetical protein
MPSTRDIITVHASEHNITPINQQRFADAA